MKKIVIKTIIPLLLIVILGAVVRFYRLADVPVALNGDEAGFGYNAFAIVKTLRDEHGAFLPLVFKSFGDYKPPVFVYLLAPLTGIFGLNELVVRAPIAFVSTILIVLTYLISQKIFRSKASALIAAAMVAISPWAINFSRAGWEASLALFFTTLGVLIFLRDFKYKSTLFAVIIFIVAFYSYHAEKLAVPLLLIALFLFFKKKLGYSLKNYLLPTILFIVFAMPAIIGFTNISGQSRARGSLITNYFFQSTKDKAYLLTQGVINEQGGLLQTSITHSRIALAIEDMSSKIFAYLSPANIFVLGDDVGRHGVNDFGVLYTVDFVLILVAVYFFINKSKNDFDYFLISWLVIGLLPAMITVDKLHSIRPLLALPPLYILEGWGVVQLVNVLAKNKLVYARIAATFLSLVFIISFVRFCQSYFIYTPVERASWWQYGYKDVVLTVKQEQERFDNIIVDVPPTYGNPYIFFLFYQAYDPTLYNQTVRREDDIKNKVTAVYGFGKYQFRQIYWPNDRALGKTLFVGTSLSLPTNDIGNTTKFRLIKEIKMPDGTVVFRIVETL